jgi:CHAD domain-containing protein
MIDTGLLVMSGETINSKSSVAQDLRTGLAHWMECVVAEVANVRADFAADPVHDLRVALRRCRSLGEGFMGADRHRDWKKMRRAAKLLFGALGELRDVQVLMEWLEKLAPEDDPVRMSLHDILSAREQELKKHAERALDQFDLKQWRAWSRTLPERAARVSSGSPVFEYMALERWEHAHELHRTALRNRSKVAMHQLRIGLKKLRYIVENFLPELHGAWGRDLKELQDALGEVHDLDVLWQTAVQEGVIAASSKPASVAEGSASTAVADALRARWSARVSEERQKRVERYRQKMVGKASLWPVWRQALPQGERLNEALVAKLRLWAESASPDPAHVERVASIALRLYDAIHPEQSAQSLGETANLPGGKRPARSTGHAGPDARVLLEVAALLHDVGRDHGRRGYHKRSFRQIAALPAPIGWSAEDQRVAALVARFHRGALPSAEHADITGILPGRQQMARELSGILRLADALDEFGGSAGNERRAHTGGAPSCWIERNGSVLMVTVAGYDPYSPVAERIAGARHLFETCCGMPVVLGPAAHTSAAPAQRAQKPGLPGPPAARSLGTAQRTGAAAK